MCKVRDLSYNIFSLLTILQRGIEIVKKEIMYNFKTIYVGVFFAEKWYRKKLSLFKITEYQQIKK